LRRARAFAALGTALFLGAGSPAPEAAWRANNVGVALLERYEHEEAAASFSKALALAPGLGIARANLAIALLNAGKAADAQREATAAAALLPGMAQPPYVIGLSARALGSAEDAKAAFRQVLEIDPADVGAHVNLGQLLMQERDYAAAAAEFEKAAAADPNSATAVYNLGQALGRAGRGDESARALERFRQLREGGYGTTLGQAYPEQGRYAEALASTGAERELVDRATPLAAYVDVTAARLPGAAGGGGVALADLDGDGRLDLVSGGRRWRNAGTAFSEAFGPGDPRDDGSAAVAADYDNDARIDLLVLRPSGPALLRNEEAGFADRTAAATLPPWPGTTSALMADTDHDGDLDIVIAGGDGRLALLQNDGAGRFKDVAAAAGLSASAGTAAVVATDFDDGREIDLLVVADGALRLYKNLRDGRFRDVAAEVGLARTARFRSVGVGDFNQDSFVDFFLGVEGGSDLVALSDGRGRFVVGAAPSSGSLAALALDYDNDGLLDVLTLSREGPRLLRNLGGEWSDVTSAALRGVSLPSAAAAAAGDLDGDGDTDLVLALRDGGLRVLDNRNGRNRSLAVRLAGMVSNRAGVGAKVEVRAGSLRQKRETHAAAPAPAAADLVFGLGRREAADAVRVLWPSGTLQAELVEPSPARAAMQVKELDRKPSSCPYLYAWNGWRFEFVTDFLGGGEMGYWQGPGRFNRPDPDEYVRITDEQLAPLRGRLELRVTNELEEGLFLDRLELLAVDHPADVEVYPEEGLRSAPPPFRLFAVRDSRAPAGAWDHAGRDVRERLTAKDRAFVDGFPLHRIRGYAEEHTLVLDLGKEAGEDAVLLLTGWTDYAFSSDNVAAHQAGLAMAPPRLEVEDEAGAWRTAVAEVGIPVGRPQTLVVPLAGRWRSASRRVRVVTNMRIYWDQAAVGRAAALSPRIARLGLAGAELSERGYSAPVSPDGREPFAYDYHRVAAGPPWKVFPGRYTRPGGVQELLTTTDDMFVVSRPGDEVSLWFDAGALPPLGAAEKRTYLLFADGYSKEMDINSARPHLLEPLPYHAMPGYPYAPPAAYPLTPERLAYLERYNTRIVRAPVAPLEAELPRGGEP
jgi:tetratricopeptide (TPR) repeat protein